MLPACGSCNYYKHTFTLEKFREYIEDIHLRLMRDSTTYRIAVRFERAITNRKPVKFYFETMEDEK